MPSISSPLHQHVCLLVLLVHVNESVPASCCIQAAKLGCHRASPRAFAEYKRRSVTACGILEKPATPDRPMGSPSGPVEIGSSRNHLRLHSRLPSTVPFFSRGRGAGTDVQSLKLSRGDQRDAAL
ncbi:hypothetical protein CI102_714 [Trichoderma harzianum]|uniref:Secreted protein n=1 Tax=Trichoderma harzianum CBS 226.95 TaxID=983964 RepID=A0A2T4AIB5_TRIHA|nr:hypothetical protein M431DRAFT_387189 [Trichoderma harzianum CBS 226.95]PKK54376.1 hypothetical protein CI102_714 [Trichoderma harzianum]PTB56834.1 hypothetical protein M431DRAFT_387189 [Trichoderma harzianum CBS 226.95]